MKKWEDRIFYSVRCAISDREKIKENDPNSITKSIKDEFRNLGFNVICIDDIASICLTFKDKKYWDIVIRYLEIATDEVERFYLREGFMTKEVVDYLPFFFDEFRNCTNDEESRQISIANIFLRCSSEKYLDEYIKILADENISKTMPPCGDVRNFVIDGMSLVKCDSFKKIFIQYLDNDKISFRCLNALSKYKDESLRPIFEEFLNHDDKEYRKIAQKAIEKLDKQKEKK